LPRFLRALGRWCLRGVVTIALANLAWDLWSWQDRSFADGDRRYFRGAERGDEIEYGLAEIRIINQTNRAFLIDSFVLDGWGDRIHTRPPRREQWHPPAKQAQHAMSGAIRTTL
jgi:hypothetical protein